MMNELPCSRLGRANRNYFADSRLAPHAKSITVRQGQPTPVGIALLVTPLCIVSGAVWTGSLCCISPDARGGDPAITPVAESNPDLCARHPTTPPLSLF